MKSIQGGLETEIEREGSRFGVFANGHPNMCFGKKKDRYNSSLFSNGSGFISL